jgi:N-acetylmuramic acid 6-phosphate etherase
VSLTANPQSRLSQIVRYSIATAVGPEVLTGSSRMKAASAHKMVLNMLSTISMVRSGKCFENLMVDVKASNEKLYARAINIVVDATGLGSDEAVNYLAQTKWQVKPAILMALTGLNAQQAEASLHASRGHLRSALQQQKLTALS